MKPGLYSVCKAIPARLSSVIVVFAFVSLAHAQNSATEGTEFYVTFLKNYLPTVPNTCQIRYVVTETCHITAQYGDGTYLTDNVAYAPGVYTVTANLSKSYYDQLASGASDKMIKITSTKNIGVFALNMAAATTDATTVLPITALGNEYTIISHTVTTEPSYIAIIAPVPGTSITIRDPGGAAVVSNQTIASYNLPYFYVGAGSDLTGYTVEANHKVAVFSAVACGTRVTTGGCDHVYEQMWPSNTAGKNYFVWNMSGTLQYADKLKVIALENNTTITKKEGAASTNINLAMVHSSTFFSLNTEPYANGSSSPVWLTSDKPFIVEHLLGHAPTMKWMAPVEQRITQAILSPFVPTGTSVITSHRLHLTIPAGSQGDMLMKETRAGTTTNVTLTFYTNTSNPDYVIALKDYAAADNVLIELFNPAGLIAYMLGYGSAESYIFTAGAGAFNLQNYFTVTTKTSPYNDTYYSATTEDNHTFESSDNITLKRTLGNSFVYVKWLINGVEYTGVTENANIINTLTVPATTLAGGENTISMSVRYNGATADSVYAGKVWLSIPPPLPEAKNDRLTLFACGNKTANVLVNDLNVAGGTIAIVKNGTLGAASPASPNITYDNGVSGCPGHGGRRDTVRYKVCTMDGCDEANLFIDILRTPSIKLLDSCSRRPYLTVNYQYPAATYQWYVSPDGSTWTPISGATSLKLYVTEDARYKVAITYNGDIVETVPVHFVIHRKARLQGNRWWYESSIHN